MAYSAGSDDDGSAFSLRYAALALLDRVQGISGALLDLGHPEYDSDDTRQRMLTRIRDADGVFNRSQEAQP